MQIGARQLRHFIRLALFAGAFWAASPVQAEPGLRLLSNVVWSRADGWFGGFSGAEVSNNGARITLISDRATLVVADMLREDGTLVALQLRQRMPLTDAAGVTLPNGQSDPEGLAIDAQGRAFVSFEQDHRVARLNLKTGRTSDNMRSPEFAKLLSNAGLEALAIHPDGTLYALPEQASTTGAPIPVFTFTANEWRVTQQIPRSGSFVPVGADFGKDGLLYVLERAISPFGFLSQIRRFDLTEPDLAEQTLITTRPGRFDNFEALSVWQNAAGQTFLTLVSDDNFLALQQTQIVEFLVTE